MSESSETNDEITRLRELVGIYKEKVSYLEEALDINQPFSFFRLLRRTLGAIGNFISVIAVFFFVVGLLTSVSVFKSDSLLMPL